jgi:hypothetical protein
MLTKVLAATAGVVVVAVMFSPLHAAAVLLTLYLID